MTYIYKGEPTSLGRFGQVKPGVKLSLTSEEHWYQIKHPNPNFVLVEGQIADELGEIAPKPTPEFDLTFLDWSQPLLWRQLKARYSKLSLLKILVAMRSIGVEIEGDLRDSKEVILDRIVECYLRLGWQHFKLTASGPAPTLKERKRRTR